MGTSIEGDLLPIQVDILESPRFALVACECNDSIAVDEVVVESFEYAIETVDLIDDYILRYPSCEVVQELGWVFL